MLSTTFSYALRAVLLLARDRDRGPLSAEEIAEATGAPANYMAKTLNALAKKGFLVSTRGPAGGFSLAVLPENIPLSQLVDCFEERPLNQRCLLGNGACNSTRPCTAHHAWSAVQSARRAPLDSTTVASLLRGDNRTAPAAQLKVRSIAARSRARINNSR
jgi:Rrf2 family transcriptional regulator, iron-sulfur cluster assembly transcription factor